MPSPSSRPSEQSLGLEHSSLTHYLIPLYSSSCKLSPPALTTCIHSFTPLVALATTCGLPDLGKGGTSLSHASTLAGLEDAINGGGMNEQVRAQSESQTLFRG